MTPKQLHTHTHTTFGAVCLPCGEKESSKSKECDVLASSVNVGPHRPSTSPCND